MIHTFEEIIDLGSNYYDVTIYRYGHEDYIESFCCFGNIDDIVFSMDSIWLLPNVPDEDWNEYYAIISLDDVDLVIMEGLESPNYTVIEINEEDFDNLVANYAA